MKDVRIFSVCFLYMAISVETETVVDQETRKQLTENESFGNNRPDIIPQDTEHDTGPEEFAVFGYGRRRLESPELLNQLNETHKLNFEEHTPESLVSLDIGGLERESVSLSPNPQQSGQRFDDLSPHHSTLNFNFEKPSVHLNRPLTWPDSSSDWTYKKRYATEGPGSVQEFYATEEPGSVQEFFKRKLFSDFGSDLSYLGTNPTSSRPDSTTEWPYHEPYASHGFDEQSIDAIFDTPPQQLSSPLNLVYVPSKLVTKSYSPPSTVWSNSEYTELPKSSIDNIFPTITPCENGNVVLKILARILMLLLQRFNSDTTGLDNLNNILSTLESHLQSNGLQNGELYPKLQGLEEILITEPSSRKPDADEDIKTKIVFKDRVPKIEQGNCNAAFLKLMAIAYNSYIQLSKYPNCNKQDKDRSTYPSPTKRPPRYVPITPSYRYPTTKKESFYPEFLEWSENIQHNLFKQSNLNKKRPEKVNGVESPPNFLSDLVHDIYAPKDESVVNSDSDIMSGTENLGLGQKLLIPKIKDSGIINSNKEQFVSDLKVPEKLYNIFNQLNSAKETTIAYNPHKPSRQLNENTILKPFPYNQGQTLFKTYEVNTVKPTLAPETMNLNWIPPSESQLLSSFQQGYQPVQSLNLFSKQQTSVPDSITPSVLRQPPKPLLWSSFQTRVTFPQQKYQRRLPFPWQKTSLRQGQKDAVTPSNLSLDKLFLLPLNKYESMISPPLPLLLRSNVITNDLTLNSPKDLFGKAPDDNLPQQDFTNYFLDPYPNLPPEMKLVQPKEHIVKIFLSSQNDDFSDKQKLYLLRLLQYFRILQSGGNVSKQNDELLKLLISYLKTILDKLDVSEGQNILPPDETDFIEIFRDMIEERFLRYIIRMIQSQVPNPTDRERVIEEIKKEIFNMKKVGVDFSKIDILEQILVLLKNIIQWVNYHSTMPHFLPGVDPELSPPDDPDSDDNTNKLDPPGVDPELNTPDDPHTDDNTNKLDPKFLAYLYQLIISSVEASQQQTALLQVVDYIKELVNQGVDFTLKENLEVTIQFVKKMIQQLSSDKTPSWNNSHKINPKFLEKLYKYIIASVSMEKREFIIVKVKNYIKFLIQAGTDLSKPKNLKLVINYVNEVISRLNYFPDATTLHDKETDISPDFRKKLYLLIASTVKDVQQRQYVITQVQIYIKALIYQGKNVKNPEIMNLILKFVEETISNLPKLSADILSIMPSVIIDRIKDLILYLVPKTNQQAVWLKIQNYLNELITQDVDFSDEESLKRIVILVQEIILQTDPTLIPDSKSIDQEFLRKLWRLITSSVPLDNQETIKRNVVIYIKDLMQQGIDLTDQENLNLIETYVKELILKITPPPISEIDQNFLKNLYKYIENNVQTDNQKKFVITQLQIFIRKLIREGIGFSKNENLRLLVAFVTEMIEKYINTPTEQPTTPSDFLIFPPDEEVPRISREILTYAYELIHKLILNPYQRETAIRYLHQYIKWAVINNFDLNDRENLNQLIILIISLVKNNESVIFNQTEPGVPLLVPESIEITYTLSKKFNFDGKSGVVKFRVPYHTFVGNLRDMLLREPLLRSQRKKFEEELSIASNITEVSPELQEMPKSQLIKLISQEGSFVDAKIPDDNIDTRQVRNYANVKEFEKMIHRLDEIVNKNMYPLADSYLRKSNDEAEVNDTDELVKHYLVQHGDLSSFDPISYIASGPLSQLETQNEHTQIPDAKISTVGANIDHAGGEIFSNVNRQTDTENTTKTTVV